MATKKKAEKKIEKRARTSQIFSSSVCDIQGNIFLPSQVQKSFLRQNIRQTDSDYDFAPGLRFADEASRSWKIARASYENFARQLSKPDLSYEQRLEALKVFAKQFFGQALSYRLEETREKELEERSFPMGFLASESYPIVLGDPATKQDQKQPHFSEYAGSSNKTLFQSAQELLNADKAFSWGFSFNGTSVRLLRDSMSFTRPSYLEFSLEDIFDNDDYSEYLHLYAILHASRTIEKDGRNVWEDWIKAGEDEGEPAREKLSLGVRRAIEILGNAFLKHPKNETLREAIAQKKLTSEDYLKELLRTMYRFLFLFCLEERGLINTKSSSEENLLARKRYAEGYSMHRFRDKSLKRKFANHYTDAWKSVRVVFRGLAKGEPLLALPALGGLFNASQCPSIDRAELDNESFYSAMKMMRWATINGIFTTVDYKNMGTEELGSVYESLLELFPLIDLPNRTIAFVGDSTGDNTRKNSGSYYTPDAFVKKLISTSLIPVIERKLSEKEDKEKAILSLKVIDPACGSGHFLLGAARTLADYLAKVRSITGVISPEEYREALRDVIAHCIYGVDINELAIELARMALWLEGYSENCALSFLDHHLKVGNSVLGVFNLESLRMGISSKAYKDKTASKKQKSLIDNLRKQNQKGLKQLSVIRERAEGNPDLFDFEVTIPQIENLEKFPSSSLEDETIKAEHYKKNQAILHSSHVKQLCDCFMAGYLADKKEQPDLIPTSKTMAQLIANVWPPEEPKEKILSFSEELCRERKAFHWPLEFPEVFSAGGFDCVLGNPPWDTPQVEDIKWFCNRLPTIALAGTAAIRKKMIAALGEGTFGEKFQHLEKNQARSEWEKELFNDYQELFQHASAASIFRHVDGEEGGRFPLAGHGKANLYAYFAELTAQLLNSQGSAGIITPVGLLTDETTKEFAAYSLDGNLRSVYHFDNTEKLFPIDSRYSFALITFAKSEQIDCVFYASRIEHLDDLHRHVLLTKEDIVKFNPNTQTLVLVRTDKDLEILRKLYNVATVFKREEGKLTENNLWSFKSSTMFNLSTDSGLFQSSRDGMADPVPLYEGKMIHQFDDRWATFDNPRKNDEPRDVTLSEKQVFNFRPKPQFWVEHEVVLKKFLDKNGESWWQQPWMLGFRDVSSPTNQRTLIYSILPSSFGVGHTINLFFPKRPEPEVACLLANFNSLTLDFVQRIKQSGSHVSRFLVHQLPVLPPNHYSEKAREYIVPRVAKLTRNSREICDVWLTDFPDYKFQDPRERLEIRAELDAYIARLYRLSREDLAYILDPQGEMGEDFPSVTFPSLKKEEIEKYGEFLTKRLVLEAFDKLENMEVAGDA